MSASPESNDPTAVPIPLTLELQHEIEQWYYREARLLDGRQYQTWLGLCAPEIQYVMPARGNPLVDNRKSGAESMIDVERELEGQDSSGNPIRDERMPHLMLRVDRNFKPNSWAENPPARTRRIVGNIEIIEADRDRLRVVSAFHLYSARPGSRSCMYAGQRRDVLVRGDDGLKIARREIILDMAEIEYPSLGLFF